MKKSLLSLFVFLTCLHATANEMKYELKNGALYSDGGSVEVEIASNGRSYIYRFDASLGKAKPVLYLNDHQIRAGGKAEKYCLKRLDSIISRARGASSLMEFKNDQLKKMEAHDQNISYIAPLALIESICQRVASAKANKSLCAKYGPG
ncbi:hypothetical protein D9M72_487820 [compost metagenome]